jgi:hypothetical protein
MSGIVLLSAVLAVLLALGGRGLAYCRALCQPSMGGDPIASIFFGSEFAEMADDAIGPPYLHTPNPPFSYRR